MRRLLALALPLGLLAAPAMAQHWNDSGPGRDLLSSTMSEFDSFRQRAPQTGSTASAAGGRAQDQVRAPIPILDWVPPPPAAATAPRRRAAPQRRMVRRTSPAPMSRDPAPLPASAPAPTLGGGDPERSLNDRERELDRLRRILEEDRLRYQQARQPQLR